MLRWRQIHTRTAGMMMPLFLHDQFVHGTMHRCTKYEQTSCGCKNTRNSSRSLPLPMKTSKAANCSKSTSSWGCADGSRHQAHDDLRPLKKKKKTDIWWPRVNNEYTLAAVKNRGALLFYTLSPCFYNPPDRLEMELVMLVNKPTRIPSRGMPVPQMLFCFTYASCIDSRVRHPVYSPSPSC